VLCSVADPAKAFSGSILERDIIHYRQVRSGTYKMLNPFPGSSDFMKSSQNLKKAIKCEQSKRKGYPQKQKTYHDLSKIPCHLTITADGKPFLTLIPE